METNVEHYNALDAELVQLCIKMRETPEFLHYEAARKAFEAEFGKHPRPIACCLCDQAQVIGVLCHGEPMIAENLPEGWCAKTCCDRCCFEVYCPEHRAEISEDSIRCWHDV